ncbi:polysaccharide deacetylase family protein [Alkalihalobacillus sp. AL-G]|uniref:polysaccharide deacetylase family protein n=1 Tax=Alkalihalobacillus sp. AL-G TaxID=2926399 RepID=UPI00272AE578|nr:polysaccharide deacetylase family protein [Alkalihalobacillus sp. AL-G]WLD94233.1 polysaccharide deacetylase family protein [Alkalihalobacillus sp. AL-G]
MKKFIMIFAISLTTILFTLFGLYQLMNARSFQVFGGLVEQVNTEEKVVALTFDDGPTEKTDDILKILADTKVKATFFLNGNMIKKNPEAAKSIVQAGHELGNHTYSHQRMIFKSYSFIENEIERTDEAIRKVGYKGDIHFRPPNGKKLFLLPFYLNKHDKKTIMWNIEPDSDPEIAGSSDRIFQHVNETIEPGSIILLHVMYDNEERESLEAVEKIIHTLKDKGYSFQTVSELLESGSD